MPAPTTHRLPEEPSGWAGGAMNTDMPMPTTRAEWTMAVSIHCGTPVSVRTATAPWGHTCRQNAHKRG
jgi:hypothetical protein